MLATHFRLKIKSSMAEELGKLTPQPAANSWWIGEERCSRALTPRAAVQGLELSCTGISCRRCRRPCRALPSWAGIAPALAAETVPAPSAHLLCPKSCRSSDPREPEAAAADAELTQKGGILPPMPIVQGLPDR